MAARVPFERAGHLIVVPVRLNGSIKTRFVLDTGIGVNLVSEQLVKQAGWAANGTIASGRRMSGQEIQAPLGNLPVLELGGRRWENLLASPVDMGGFHPILKDLGGFLSLGLFESVPITVDYQNSLVELGEPGSQDSARRPEGEEVALAVQREGPSVSAKIALELPSGSVAHVEVDTGTDSLILHDRYLEELGVRPGTPNVRTAEGQDETSHGYVRHFAQIRGQVRPHGTSTIFQDSPEVMFQEIIHDGLVGDDFLKRFRVTLDIERARMGFEPK